MDKLEPCPFCGGEARIGYWKSRVKKSWIINCTACICSMGECYDKEQLIKWWNARKGEEVKDEVS